MKMNQNKFSRMGNASGFTLIEVMVGILIFAFVATTLFRMVDQGFRIMESARDYTRVTQILEQQTESLRGTSWSSIETIKGTRSIKVDATGAPTAGTSVVPFDWQAFAMTSTITQEKPDLYKAVLTAKWTNRKGDQRTRTFSTHITKDGLNAFFIRATS